CSVTMPSAPRSARTPMRASRRSTVDVSFRSGTLASTTGSADSSPAHSMGNAEFWAPEIVTSPCSGEPPVMRSLSMVSAACLGVFVGRKGTHGQCMDFSFHAVAQRGIDHLVPRDEALAFKGGADYDRIEVRAVALDRKSVV